MNSSEKRRASPLAIGCGLVGAILLVPLLVFYVILPLRVLAQYRSFVARHGVGTDVGTMVGDPFVRRSTMVFIDDKPLPSTVAATGELPGVVARLDRGRLDVMWTYTPPFGRVSYVVTFEHGTITSARSISID